MHDPGMCVHDVVFAAGAGGKSDVPTADREDCKVGRRRHSSVVQRGPTTAEITDGQRQKTCSCLLYTSPSPRDGLLSRMPSSA